MLKKLIALALVAMVAVGVFAACRAPEDNGASSTTSTAPTTAPTSSTTASTSSATTAPTQPSTGTLDSTTTTGGAKMPRMR